MYLYSTQLVVAPNVWSSPQGFTESWELYGNVLRCGLALLAVTALVSVIFSALWWACAARSTSAGVRRSMCVSTAVAAIAWAMAVELAVRMAASDFRFGPEPYHYPTTLVAVASSVAVPVVFLRGGPVARGELSKFARFARLSQVLSWASAVFVAFHFLLLV